ncbi:hypothetical protein BH23VER1_BH23VER1_11190 [soil metagenome]
MLARPALATALAATLAAALTVGTSSPLRADDSPAAELASFRVADGFEVNLFASEADGVVKPIQIRFDPRGRLWVIGSTVYPHIKPDQVADDKILILEDTDGDGVCDKTTVFADGLLIPTGIELVEGGAYVGHGTELLLLKDTDGDDRADERHVVFRGFGTGDSHQNINSFLWGPGGDLWMCQGLHAFSNVETPWGIERLHEAGLWRYRPQRAKLDGFIGGNFSPQNPWGYVFTEWGEPLVMAGNNSEPIYPVPILVSRDKPAQLPTIWPQGHGRKVSGADIVGTTHFPDDWQGRLISGGYINNAVWSLRIHDDGAGFRLEDAEPLIESTSRSFRPVDTKFGPDGALYLCDWYNPIIGHYQASFRHPDRDRSHGRIWRVTAKNRPPTERPTLASMGNGELVGQLASPDRWTRQFAKRALADRPAAEVVEALDQWINAGERSEHSLVEALGVYRIHESPNPDLLATLCAAADPGARAFAASTVGAWAERLDDPLGFLRPLVSDAEPRVRLQAVVAATYVPSPEAMDVAAAASDHPTDRFLDFALDQAVFALKPHWLPALQNGTLGLVDHPPRIAFLVAADGTADVLDATRNLAGKDARYLAILAEVGAPSDLDRILALTDPQLLAHLLPIVAETDRLRGVRPTGDLDAQLAPLVSHPDPRVIAAALHLAGQWRLPGFQSSAEAYAGSGEAPAAVRLAAISTLGRIGGAPSLGALLFLANDQSAEIRAAAVAALAGLDPTMAAPPAAAVLQQVNTPAETESIIAAFLARSDGPAALAEELAAAPPPKAVASTALAFLGATGHRDDALAQTLASAAGFTTQGGATAPADLTAFATEVREHGDPARGAAIYARPELACVACHAIDGTGGILGPDLSALGSAQPVDFIVGAILDPQREIKEGYLSVAVTTHEGTTHSGNLIRESEHEIVVGDALTGSEIRIPHPAIAARQEIGSIMPENLTSTLTPDEFRDLVRYLSERGTTKE